MTPLLDGSNVSFAYTGDPVLRDVSVHLEAGQVIALIGPNGSGKSTLLRVLLGQLRGAAGGIRWDGREIRAWNRRELARWLAYLPQSPTNDPDHRVIDVLRLGRSPYWSAFGIESARDGEVVARVAGELGLDDLLDRRMDELSGGQRQRAFVGRCLVQQPAALLLDEPGTFLDLRHQVELLELLRKLARERSIGVLMASHDLNLASAYADRMLLLDNGAVAATGGPCDVMSAELISRVYRVEMDRIDRGENRAPLLVPRAI